MSDVLRFIDLSSVRAGLLPPLFSVIDDAMGPCNDDLNVRLQGDLKDAFHRRCNLLGKTMAERVRELMALDALGEEHVRSLMLKHCNVIATAATHPGAAPAPTSAGIAQQEPQAVKA